MAQHSYGRPGDYTPTGKTRLDKVSTWDLGCALLARLRAGENQPSHMATEAHLALLEALRDAIEGARDTWQNPYALRKSGASLHFFGHCHRRHGVPFRDATWIDLGCGASNPFARLFPVLLLGARRVLCIELEPPRDLPKALRHLVDMTAAALVDPQRLFGNLPVDRQRVLVDLADFDFARLAKGDAGGLPPQRLELLQQSIVATSLPPASADVLVSNSVLEHLPDVEAALREFARLTRPGGYGIHGIDTVDHRWYGNPAIHPLEFLTMPSPERIVHECNRLRLGDFEALFDRHGFDLLDAWRGPAHPVPANLRARLVEPWRSRRDEELAVTWAEFLVRKRGP